MALLLDTHALIWWFSGNPRLSEAAAKAITETAPVFVSAVSAWEIATKHRLGKLPNIDAMAENLAGVVDAAGFAALPMSFDDGALAGRLPGPHRDPFDRMLIAQALARDLTLVSCESAFDRYGVRRLW